MIIIILSTILLSLCCCPPNPAVPATEDNNSTFEVKVVAGSSEDYMIVRHVVMRGTNYDIGKHLAEFGRQASIQPIRGDTPLRNRVQRKYMKNNYPILYERMKGLADGFGLSIADDYYDFSALSGTPGDFGCSVVYYPPNYTDADRGGILSRNYDFSTGDFTGEPVPENVLSPSSRPVVFEIYPDKGYPSLFVCAYDLMGGVIDGINSEGLVVAILAEQESMSEGHYESAPQGIGLHELASMRYLLDNCKNVAEAKEALLSLKHYYSFIPCHYIVADREGHSYIFEFSPHRQNTFIVEGEGPQCITNHLVSRYKSVDEMPDGNSYHRFRVLHQATSLDKRYSIDEIKAINASVAVPPRKVTDPTRAPHRTLWHAVYDTYEKSLEIKFYLGEKPDPQNKDRVVLKYSDYIKFKLNPKCKGGS